MTQVDLSKLSAAELAKLLAQARVQEKARKAELDNLPRFAYLVIMTDSSLVFWSGKAIDQDAAKQAAIDYAKQEGKEVFDLCTRPLPQPKGRKVKVQDETSGD